MSRFTSHLGLQLVEDDDGKPVLRAGRCLWDTIGDLSYDIGEKGSGVTIYVEGGTRTDLASIPRLAWTLLPPDGPWLKAAVLHDKLYETKGDVTRLGHPELYTRAEADAILNEAMGVLGVPDDARALIYRGVRVGGSRAWGS